MLFMLQELIRELWLPFVIVFVMCFIYIKYSCVNYFVSREKSLSCKNVLFVTAHPDDECMFFAPTILSVLAEGHNVFVVCLSKGDYYGQGDIRKKELISSCSKLGVPASNVTIVDDERLKDDPGKVWDVDFLGSCIMSVCLRVNADCVVTFDKAGVSGHSNHTALYAAIQKLHKSGRMVDRPVFILESVNLVRKYTSLLDVPYSSISSPPTFVNSPWQVVQSVRAMMAHKSQLVWFRKLYVLFSRYMYVNTLQQL